MCARVGVLSSPILISLSALEDLISWKANEFLTRVSSGLSKPLTPLFKRLMSFHYLKEEQIVVGTYNDLVLCCASLNYQRDYYICNPYTRQWVALPPTPNCVRQNVAVGFICDTPYYEEDDSDKKEIIINGKTFSSVFSVEIFSSETGEWRKSIVSSPQAFEFIFSGHCEISYTYNRMLYWMGDCLDEDIENNLIGLDPFMMDDNSMNFISLTLMTNF
ncbi:hypothetical protein DVH24_026903 [Malus domestica]|uniref:F-box protein At3g26010-like beta-propeller domain-containing protein n=1 Tax=Malus domestica TaxID=3750 RepID=A0A498IP73_MALDO|nr:hypothetical protein DVH24_026903 [Malus domestica]